MPSCLLRPLLAEEAFAKAGLTRPSFGWIFKDFSILGVPPEIWIPLSRHKPPIVWDQSTVIFDWLLTLSWILTYFLCKTLICNFQAKLESDRIISSVGKKPLQESGIKVRNRSNALSLTQRKDLRQILMGITGEPPYRLMDLNMKEFTGFQIGILNTVRHLQVFIFQWNWQFQQRTCKVNCKFLQRPVS